jgi:hypothetical protein
MFMPIHKKLAVLYSFGLGLLASILYFVVRGGPPKPEAATPADYFFLLPLKVLTWLLFDMLNIGLEDLGLFGAVIILIAIYLSPMFVVSATSLLCFWLYQGWKHKGEKHDKVPHPARKKILYSFSFGLLISSLWSAYQYFLFEPAHMLRQILSSVGLSWGDVGLRGALIVALLFFFLPGVAAATLCFTVLNLYEKWKKK